MRIAIAGAGIAGLALAAVLEHDDHEIVVAERSPHLRAGGYMVDFYGPGYDAAEQLGWLPALERLHYPIRHLRVVDARGRTRYALSYPRIRRLFGNRHLNVLRGDLERMLYEMVRGRVEVRFGCAVTSFDQDGTGVDVQMGGRTERFDLLVGADGVHSAVRAQLLGERDASVLHALGYHAISFIAEGVDVRTGGDFCTFAEVNRMAAVYPLRDGRLAAFFLHPAVGPVRGREPAEELRARYGHMGWVVPELIAACATAADVYFDVVAQVRAPTWTRGRVVLTGDAAWCVSLVAGQGVSLALAGASELAQRLREPGEAEAALARYEAALRPEVASIQTTGVRFARWFLPDSRWRMVIRDLVVRASATRPVAWLVGKRFRLMSGKL